MKKRTLALVSLFSLLTLIVLASSGLCQAAGKQSSTSSEAPAVTLKGKVVLDQRSHNYMFYQEEPPYSEFFIMNDNVGELKALAESQKIVTVEGSMPRGADSLLIDKIDGKKFGKGK